MDRHKGKRVVFYVDAEEHEKLLAIAASEGKTISETIRFFIREWEIEQPKRWVEGEE